MSSPDWETYRDIVDVHLRFAQALDENDWALYRQCLAERLVADYSDVGLTPVNVEADAWTAFVKEAVTPQTTVHYFTNFSVDVEGAAASVRLNHQSSHFVPNSGAGEPTYVQRGTYRTELAFDGRRWAMTRIVHRVAFATGNPGLAGEPSQALLEAQDKIYS